MTKQWFADLGRVDRHHSIAGLDLGIMMRSRICTRAVALIVAYAIVLHGFLIAFAGFPLVAGALSDGGISRLELCLHDLVGGALPQPPSAPEGADVHCKFCIGQAHAMALAPPSCGAQLNFRTPSAPIWFVLNQVTTGFPRYLHKQPRGPPAAA